MADLLSPPLARRRSRPRRRGGGVKARREAATAEGRLALTPPSTGAPSPNAERGVPSPTRSESESESGSESALVAGRELDRVHLLASWIDYEQEVCWRRAAALLPRVVAEDGVRLDQRVERVLRLVLRRRRRAH